MANADIVKVPPPESVNTGLTSPKQPFMLGKFGAPGTPSPKCGKVTNTELKKHVVLADVGPFRVTGMDIAVDSLKTIFDEVETSHPDLLNGLKSAGMMCVRTQRHSVVWSNHAWGTAIDLYYGRAVTAMGRAETYRGLLDLYFFFHKHGWYWGGGFSGKRVDSMHFEMSLELIKQKFGE